MLVRKESLGYRRAVGLFDGVTDFLHVVTRWDTSVVHLAPRPIPDADRPPRGGWCARTMCGLVWHAAPEVADEAQLIVAGAGGVCGCCAHHAASWPLQSAAVAT